MAKLSCEAYEPTTGNTPAAPTFGTFSTALEDYIFPSDEISYVYDYIYPYLNTSSSGAAASDDPDYGETAADFLPPHAIDSDPQPLNPAGPSLTDAPGGNGQLWDVLYTITAQVTNTGQLAGDEVPQLYVSLGGPEDPPKVLRGFDRLTLGPGQTLTFSANLTRRDLSNWDITSQNWVISSYPKTAYVGSSSRQLPLVAALP